MYFSFSMRAILRRSRSFSLSALSSSIRFFDLITNALMRSICSSSGAALGATSTLVAFPRETNNKTITRMRRTMFPLPAINTQLSNSLSFVYYLNTYLRLPKISAFHGFIVSILNSDPRHLPPVDCHDVQIYLSGDDYYRAQIRYQTYFQAHRS